MILFRKLKLLLAFFVVIISLSSCSDSSVITPGVNHGTYNLKDWDFAQNGPVKLNGEWEFYWHQFLKNDSPGAETDYLEVPGLWNNKINGEKKLPGQGYASLRMVLQLPGQKEYALRYINSATSCKVFINGELFHKAGDPGKTKQTTQPGYEPATILFYPETDTTEIVLQIANFHHKKGGQWEPLTLGLKDQIQKMSNTRLFLEIVFFGAIMVMALFHIILFLFHRQEVPSLYFGIFAFLIAIRFLVAGEFPIYLLGSFNWNLLVKTDYLGFYAAIIFFALFIEKMFPLEISKRVVSVAIALMSTVVAITIFTEPLFFSHMMAHFQYFVIGISLYAIYCLVIAVQRKRDGAMLFLIGFVSLILLAIHDILNENEIIHSITLSSLGVTLFILFKSSILALRTQKALVTNKNLSSELATQNKEYQVLFKRYKKQNRQLKKAKEKAEESDRFKSAFLANISHEIRTPMNGIIGFSDLIAKPDLSEDKRRKYHEIIKERGKLLLGIVNDIIDISKIESGQVVIHNENIPVNQLFDQLLSSYLPLCKNKGINLNKSIPVNQTEVIISADHQKLKQILENLLSNAYKFTETGHIEAGYKIEDESIVFFIKDTGIGLNENEIKTIFDRFNQGNEEISKKFGGTGLGLSIVKAYVEKMEGKIWVKSKKNRGSDFYFSLPFKGEEMATTPQQIIETPLQRQHHNNILILLVEDNESNMMLIQEILSSTEYKMIHAANGKEAIQLFKQNPQINLVLMDIKLPDSDGYTLTKEMKSMRNEVPIIAQTAFAFNEDREKAIAAGCIDHISKPIDPEQLLSLIKKYSFQ